MTPSSVISGTLKVLVYNGNVPLLNRLVCKLFSVAKKSSCFVTLGFIKNCIDPSNIGFKNEYCEIFSPVISGNGFPLTLIITSEFVVCTEPLKSIIFLVIPLCSIT